MNWWCSATGQAWEWSWRFYPGVWLFLLILVGGYWRIIRPAPRAERQRAMRWGGSALLLVWLLLDWPVGALGAGYLVSVHAAQFLGLAFMAPPLFLLGIPESRWAQLEVRVARAPGFMLVTHPVATGSLFVVTMVITHLPSVVDPLMAQQLGAFAIDLAWLGSGLLFWWPIIAPVPVRAGGPLGKIVYLFVGTIAHTAIGVWLLLSRSPLYRVYELAPPIAGRSALVDQGIAGGLMELVGGVMIISAIAVLFFRWARADH